MLKIEFSLPLTDEDRIFLEQILGKAAEANKGKVADETPTPEEIAVEIETVEEEVIEEEVEEEKPKRKPRAAKSKPKTKPKPEPVEEDDGEEAEDNVVALDVGTDEEDDDEETDWIAKALAEAQKLVKLNQRGPVIAALKAVGAKKVTEIEDQDTAKEFYGHLENN